MISFSKAKDMFKLQRDAKRVKKELRNIHVEAESSDGRVKVVVSAEQEIVSIVIAPDVPNAQIGEMVKDALNRATKKAQVIASERMQGIMGDMGMPT